MTISLNLVVVRCADVELARSLYESLGLSFIAEQHGAGPRHYSAAVGETTLELYPHDGIDTKGLRLGFRVSSVGQLAQAWADAGGRVVRMNVAGEPPSAVLEDADGHKIEIVQG